jgi:hypothetical protein
MILVRTYFVPNRDLLGLGRGLMLIVFILTGLWALCYSLILTFSNSLPVSIVISLVFSFWMSWGTFQTLIEIYQRTDYFDREYFLMDIIQIGANFIIYPLTSFLIWTLQKRFVNIVN